MSATNWVSCMPEDDVEDFTERSDERRQVFEDAARRLDTKLSPLIWVFLRVGGLEQVKEIAQNRYSWMTVKANHEPISAREAKDAVLLWKQRPAAKTDTTPASKKRSFSGAFSHHSPSSPLRPQPATPTLETRTRSGKPLQNWDGGCSFVAPQSLKKERTAPDRNLLGMPYCEGVVERFGAGQRDIS